MLQAGEGSPKIVALRKCWAGCFAALLLAVTHEKEVNRLCTIPRRLML